MISLREFSEKCGLSENDLLGKSRKEQIVIAREIYWLLLSNRGVGHRQISKIAGRSKQTVSSGIKTVKNLIETKHYLIEPFQDLII